MIYQKAPDLGRLNTGSDSSETGFPINTLGILTKKRKKELRIKERKNLVQEPEQNCPAKFKKLKNVSNLPKECFEQAVAHN